MIAIMVGYDLCYNIWLSQSLLISSTSSSLFSAHGAFSALLFFFLICFLLGGARCVCVCVHVCMYVFVHAYVCIE